jgi:Ankyrin repeats (3 copies)
MSRPITHLWRAARRVFRPCVDVRLKPFNKTVGATSSFLCAQQKMSSVIDSLIDAIYGSQTKRAASLIRRGAPVNGSGRSGSTPLYLAAVQGEAEIVRLLLEAGADPNQGVAAYQVRQTERGATVKVQLIGNLRNEELEREIELALRKVGLADPHVTVTPVETIDRGATGKLKRFVPMGSM